MSSATLGYRAQDIYEDLRQQLEQGLIGEGERLPSQRVLAGRYEVSITTVNKAIGRLLAEKRVWSRRGAGVYVTARPAPHAGSRIISYMYMADRESLLPAQHAALRRGCLLSVFSQCQSQWHPDAERVFLEQVRDQRHLALLAFCSPTEPHNDDLLREVAGAGVRVIHLEPYRQALPDQEYLLPDYRRAARLAALELAAAGYGPLYFYGYPAGMSPACTLLHEGLAEARTERHVPLADDYVLLRPKGSERFLHDLRALFTGIPAGSAVILQGDGHADRVRQVAQDIGLNVPGELGLITIDLPGDPGADVDTFHFDRTAALDSAMAAAVEGQGKALRALLQPQRLQKGTVR